MKINTGIQTLLIVISIVPFFMSSCKKEIETTIIQQDTIIQHDTVFMNYSHVDYYASSSIPSVPFILVQHTSPVWTDVIYSVLIDTLHPGDLVFATVECDVTNNYLADSSITEHSQIIIGDDSGKLPSNAGIFEVCEPNSTNVTPPIHHLIITQTGTYMCTSTLLNNCINFCMYASAANTSLYSLTVGSGTGKLSVIVYRKSN